MVKQLVNFITCGCESSQYYHQFNKSVLRLTLQSRRFFQPEVDSKHSESEWNQDSEYGVGLRPALQITKRVYFSYIIATSFSGGSQKEPPTMVKQLVNFITCGCESSAPFTGVPHCFPILTPLNSEVFHKRINS
jgi:hypothetical protein